MYPSGPQSLGAFEALVVQCPSLEHLVIRFGAHLLSQNRHAPPYRLPTLASLRLLTFTADLSEAEVPHCLMTSLPAQTPNLEVLVFRFGGQRNTPPRWKPGPEENADEALLNHRTLYQTHFTLLGGAGSCGFARRVCDQLPRAAADGRLGFSAAMGWRGDQFNDLLGDPMLNHAEDLYEPDDSGSSVDEEEDSGSDEGSGSDEDSGSDGGSGSDEADD
ncbi:hypothetical protein C8R46DRAFT_498018 [Mycena filopes]|nr:hypothetical protein C8R46DRAFT_498018 [Mycena filopes]